MSSEPGTRRAIDKICDHQRTAWQAFKGRGQGLIGGLTGLCIPIEFPDATAPLLIPELNQFFNQPGFQGWGNHGSVFDYFHDNSFGKLLYNHQVAPWYRAQHSFDYYDDPGVDYGVRAQELAHEAIEHLKWTGFDFSPFTCDQDHHLRSLMLVFAGQPQQFQRGLWHHQYYLTPRWTLGRAIWQRTTPLPGLAWATA